MKALLTLAAAACSGLAGAVSVTARASGRPSVTKQKVHLEIYYESLCPDCHELLDNDFRKIWGETDFRDRIDLELIPFGNAAVVTEEHTSPGYHFWHPEAKYPAIICQHFEGECLGNEIHACANHSYGSGKMVDLVLCMVGKQAQGEGIEKSSYDCMVNLGISSSTIKSCVGSDESKQRMIDLGIRSTRSELQRKYVPWVMIDNVHVDFPDDGEKGHDIITPLCGMLAEPLPQLCAEHRRSKGSKTATLIGKPPAKA
jgi:hypothetical protein